MKTKFGNFDEKKSIYTNQHSYGLLSVASTTLFDLIDLNKKFCSTKSIYWPSNLHEKWNDDDKSFENIYDIYFKINEGEVDKLPPIDNISTWIGDCSKYDFTKIKPYIHKYFNLSAAARSRQDFFNKKYSIDSNYTIGIMYRGTDKSTEAPLINPQVYLDCLQLIPDFQKYRILLLTDQDQIIKFFQNAEINSKKLTNLFVINEMPTTCGNYAIHDIKDKSISNVELGINYISIVQILSKCKYLIVDAISNASLWIYLYRGSVSNSIQIQQNYNQKLKIFNNINTDMINLDKNSMLKQGIYIQKMTDSIRIINIIKMLRCIKSKYELIRIGSQNDGGYLLPDDLKDIKICFSPGVDVNASFELDLYTQKGINSHLADFSVNGPPSNFAAKSFVKKFLGSDDNEKTITLDSWVKNQSEYNTQGDFILQMDIEGSEYITIISTSEEVLKRFRIIIIEIHDAENWGDPIFFGIVECFFKKLLKHFNVVHNHPNNCCGNVDLGGVIVPRVFELSLLRKDRSEAIGYCRDFPHRLDSPNLRNRPDLPLSGNWFDLD